MKVRLTDDQIRLRLAAADVQRLSDGFPVRTSINLGAAGRIEWTLEARPDVTHAGVSLHSADVVVVIPFGWVEALGSGKDEGLHAEMPTGLPSMVSLLIETDLPCRHPAPDRA